jgi:hypothetical protein
MNHSGKVKVVIIDGMGGGLGAELVSRVKALDSGVEIIALGTNSTATERMLKAGARIGATGENAIRVSVRQADFILGPIGIVIGDSMLGEITQTMAAAVLAAPGERILLPLQNEHFHLAGVQPAPLKAQLDEAVGYLRKRIEAP